METLATGFALASVIDAVALFLLTFYLMIVQPSDDYLYMIQKGTACWMVVFFLFGCFFEVLS